MFSETPVTMVNEFLATLFSNEFSPTGATNYSSLALSALFILCVALLYVTSSTSTSSSKRSAPPQFSIGLPIVGNLLSFLKDPLDLPTRAFRSQIGNVFTVRVANENMTYLVGPDAAKAMYTAKDGDLGTVKAVYDVIQLMFGLNLVTKTSKGELRKRILRLMVPLGADRFDRYIPHIVNECKAVFDTLPDNGEIDMLDLFGRIVVPVAATCLFDKHFRDSLLPDTHAKLLDLTRGMSSLSFVSPKIPTDAHRRRDRAKDELTKIVKNILATRPKDAQAQSSLIEYVLEQRTTDGKKFPDSEYAGMILAVFFTTNAIFSTCTWLGMRVLSNDNVFRRVLEEHERVMKASDGVLSSQVIDEMDFLHVCMKETLRMNTSDQFALRRALKPLPVCDGRYEIPAGNMVVVAPFLAGLDKDVYRDPETYDPDRFLAPREEDKKKAFSYVHFGAAYHKCPGERFAYLVVKSVWTMLLKEFDVELVDRTVPEPTRNSFFQSPPSGKCTLRYKRKTAV